MDAEVSKLSVLSSHDLMIMDINAVTPTVVRKKSSILSFGNKALVASLYNDDLTTSISSLSILKSF